MFHQTGAPEESNALTFETEGGTVEVAPPVRNKIFTGLLSDLREAKSAATDSGPPLPRPHDQPPRKPLPVPGRPPAHWARPWDINAPKLVHRGELEVMHMDTTYSVNRDGDHSAVIELHGITKEGASVWINVHNFRSYFIFRTTYHDVDEIVAALEAKLKSSLIYDKRAGGYNQYVSNYSISDKKSVLGLTEEFSPNPEEEPEKGPFKYVKVEFRNPKHVKKARELLESGRLGGPHLRCRHIYEANILYELRFMVDTRLNGCQWFKVKDIRVAQDRDKRSRAQIELNVYPEDIVPIEKDADHIAPMRVMSFDIECVTQNGEARFPLAEKDPVICVAFNVVQGHPELRCVFAWHPDAPLGAPLGAPGIYGAPQRVEGNNNGAPLGAPGFQGNNGAAPGAAPDIEHYIYRDEETMFVNMAQFIRTTDPDIVTGYNINGFDVPYLMNRAKALGLFEEASTFSDLSRLKGKVCYPAATTFKSKAYGTQKSFLMHMPGRITFDLYQWMKREKKLRSYSLNAVSEEFIGDKKEDVHYTMIYPLFMGTDADRARIYKYCFKDTALPLRILKKLLIFVNSVEMCRTVGVPMRWLLERGQQAKTISILLRFAGPAGFCIPTKPPKRQPYKGALVRDPKIGYYRVPIVVLDFVSLYPSIMQAYNLCYSTFFWLKDAEKLGLRYPEDYTIPPGAEGSHGFVKPHIRMGLLPAILENILTRRRLAKGDMGAAKRAGNTVLAEIMDGRQLALKITANSVYGFTSADRLPLTYIAAAVTAFGRDLITFTEAEIKREFNADVIYGDTDSVMINFGDVTMERAMELGKAASNFMRPKYTKPLDCAWEKCYYPFLLIEKKRYAGLFWTKPDAPDKSDYKGIEVVRRDWTLFCTEVLTQGLSCLLNDKNIQGVIECVHKACEDMLLNRVDISKLILSKGYTKPMEEYEANGTQVPVHIQVVKNAQKRDAASAPVVGDRVSYVITQGIRKERKSGGRGWGATSISERAEDPLYVMNNDVPLDAMWYIENQLMGPCIRLFQVPLCITEEEKKQLKDPEYYEKHPKETVAYKKLFVGKHMLRRVTTIRKAEPGKLTAFVARLPQCLVCHDAPARKARGSFAAAKNPEDTGSSFAAAAAKDAVGSPLGTPEDARRGAKATAKALFEPTCGAYDCLNSIDPTPYKDSVVEKKKIMEEHQGICVECQGGVPYDDILCENRVCENWYRRFKSKKDYEDAQKLLERF